MPKKKNAARCAPAAFDGLLDLVQYGEAGLLGHLVHDGGDGGDATVFAEHSGAHVNVAPGSWRRVLQDFSTTPVGATLAGREVVVDDHQDAADVDFYVFESRLPVLFVRKPGSESVVHGVSFDAEWQEYTISALTDSDRPWPDFFINASPSTPVWKVTLPCTTQVPGAAAQLVRAGYIVACCGQASPPPFVRVKSCYLKPTADSACATTMSTINDAMPGLTNGTDLYTTDLQVHRCMLHWSMLAGCRAVHGKDAVPVTEPLKSYVDTLAAVKTHRGATGRVDTFSLEQVHATLRYNVASELTAAQRQQAISFFYWATFQPSLSEHTRGLLRRALNMYLYFGFVVLRKRAYEFRGKGKKKRDAATNTASTT